MTYKALRGITTGLGRVSDTKMRRIEQQLPAILTKDDKKMYLNKDRGIYKDHPTSGKSKCKCRDYTYEELIKEGYK